MVEDISKEFYKQSGIWAGIGGIVLFISLLMSCAFIKHKTRKTKEDILQCEKHIISILSFGLLSILRIVAVFTTDNNKENNSESLILQTIAAFLIYIMIVSLYLIKCFTTFEKFLTYKYPNHLFNSIIYAYKTKLWYEGIIILFAAVFFVLYFFIGDDHFIWKVDYYFWPFYTIVSIITLTFSIMTLRLFTMFEFKNKSKLVKVMRINIFISVLYLINAGISAYNGIDILLEAGKMKALRINISMYSIISLCIIDYCLNFYLIGYSTFCQLKLSTSCIGFFLRCCLRNKVRGFLEEDFIVCSNGPREKNRVHACYENGYYFEDYQIDFIDEIFNVTLSSLYKVYQDKSIYSLSPVGLGISHDLGNSTSIYSKQQGISYKEFEYVRGEKVDDFKEKVSQYNECLKVTGKVYFTDECNEVARQRNINLIQIASSLTSHMKDNGFGSYLSLIGHNASDQSFKSMQAFSLKSYDKDYVIEYYNQLFDRKNEKLNDVMIKYFAYIKEANGSFLPLVVGVIELKINSFGTMLLIISRNPIVENSPKIFYNYWQLIRFGEANFEKISSSKCTNNLLINDDCIFDRKFKVDEKNNKVAKIIIKNWQDLFDTTKSDLLFLRKIQCKQFNLIMMYYEFGIDAEPENMGCITENSTNNNLNLFNLPSQETRYIESHNVNQNNCNNYKESLTNVGDNLRFDDISIIGNGNFSKIKPGNMIDFTDNINIYGYEGEYDQYKCLCFFSFENIFDFRKKMTLTNFYSKYHERVLSVFADYSS